MENKLNWPTTRWVMRSLLPGFFFAAAAVTANAQLPQSQLHGIEPVAAKAGESIEFTAKGKDLEGKQTLLFSHPGITAEPVVEQDELLGKQRVVPGKWTVKVAPNVPSGTYDVAVVGKYGASNPLGFAVTDLPVARKSKEEPIFKVEVGSAFYGVMEKEKPESFVVPMKGGQTATVTCFARRLGSRLDGVFRVMSPGGKEVGSSSRTGHSIDPAVTFTASAEGDYRVEFLDYTYNGGDGFGYLVEVRDGEPDKPSEGGDGFVQEDEGKDSDVDFVQNINFPAKVSGRFLDTHDRDTYEFEAGGESDVFIDLHSDRLGELTDPVILVERVEVDKEGKETLKTVVEGDDWNGPGGRMLDLFHRDPSVSFKAGKDTAKYRVSVWNRFPVRLGGARYQLSIGGPQPAFKLIATTRLEGADPKRMEPLSPVVWSGGAARLEVYAIRSGGFDGPINIRVDGLPGGVTAEAAPVPRGADQADILLRANDGSPSWSGLIKIVGEAQVGGTKLTANAGYRTGMWVAADMNREQTAVRESGDIILSVLEDKAPGVTLNLAESPSLESCLGGKVSIPVKMEVGGDLKLKGNVAVTAVGFAGYTKPPNMNIDPNKKEGTLNLEFKNGGGNTFAAGEYVFLLRGEAQFDYVGGPEQKEAAEKEKEEIQAALKSLEDEFKNAGTAKADAAKKLDEAKKALAAIKEGPDRKKAEDAVKAAESASAEAVKIEADLKSKVDAGKKALQEIDQRIKAETDKLKPKAVKFASYTKPISIKLAASPIVPTAAAQLTIAAGEKGDVAIKVERKYDFNGNVQVSLTAPTDMKGVKLILPGAANATDGKDAVLSVSVPEDSAAGKVELTATIKGNNNGFNFEEKIPVIINVTPKKG